MTETAVYEDLRPLLFSIAYRMLGSAGDAEDVVQEAFIRYARAEEEIESPRAWLSATTTRLAIDHLRSARVRREQYVGQWVPEPLLTDEVAGPADDAETADTISLAFLVLLESLSPVERAVFLLHDVFDFAFDEIAPIVGRSEANCRQIAVRARRQIEARKPRFDVSPERRDELVARFAAAAGGGDLDALVEMLAEDAVMVGDGGGRAPAAPEPIRGRERVANAFIAFTRQALRRGARMRLATVNAQPGFLGLDPEGRIIGVAAFDVVDGKIQTIRGVTNPDKLDHLGQVGDLYALLKTRPS
jgi:RNA polymerase sigma-70 factor (ECF subfamily)